MLVFKDKRDLGCQHNYVSSCVRYVKMRFFLGQRSDKLPYMFVKENRGQNIIATTDYL